MRWALMVLLAACAPAPAQERVKFDDLPPPMRLGVRAELLRRQWPAAAFIVVVPDARSYVEAIGRWNPEGRFPVLIDDGTDAAREDIARFVRAYSPGAVLEWKAPGDWPPAPEDRRALVEEAHARVWSAESGDAPAMIAAWKRLELIPPGIVAADIDDPAWPAALALAAGRAQPLAWISARSGISAVFTTAELESLAREIERACEASGLSWRGLGDDLDAITLCLNSPVKVADGPDAVLATTDLLGRHAAEGRRDAGERWAWAGQVFGSEAQAAYRAMCALFLTPRRAWLFDGYPDHEPWSAWDASAAGRILDEGGIETIVDDSPRGTERQWRLRSSRALNAGLVLVNTKGNADHFDLEPGRCRPGDVPLLGVPAMVCIVHSWSAQAPSERRTVAGRWLERGAYAYFGSVHEPFLQAFVPTPIVAARLVHMYPWGAAARSDGGPGWKLAVIGDPLITVGPAPARSPRTPPFENAAAVGDELRAALVEREFERALACLVLLGRDADAAELFEALRRDEPGAVTARMAVVAIPALFREHRRRTLVDAFALLSVREASIPGLRDALWNAMYPIGPDAGQHIVGLLRTNMREEQAGRDAAELARAVAALFGRETALGMLGAAQAGAAGADREAVEAAIKMLEGR